MSPSAEMHENPLRAGLSEQRHPDPCVMVIFGASGDLTHRKLIPALYTDYTEKLLPAGFSVLGVARQAYTDERFREEMRKACDRFARHRPSDALWTGFARGLFYQAGTFEDPRTYKALRERLEAIDRERGTHGNRVYYLATAPQYTPVILRMLKDSGLISDSDRPFTRVIFEKPFGTDLATARRLNAEIRTVLREDQTYRIDHYLGKETVQNILVFRFANGIFEPIWNQKYVDHVQLTVAESIGVEGRGGYFESAGITRDIVQNHMFQFLALMAMEPPVAFEADAVRDEKLKVLRALRPVPADEVNRYVVRGQYGPGSVGGEAVPGYREEPGVARDSLTDTYVAMKLFIDSWRWAGVPFYLRAGKRLAKRVSEIAVYFKAAPLPIFATAAGGASGALGEAGAALTAHDRHVAAEPNVLAIRIQPDEGISLRFGSKVPGPTIDIHPVTMEFRYGTSFGVEPPEAYERLLLDAMIGDPTLFTRGDEVEAAWVWINHVMDAWKEQAAPELPSYEAGSWGPREAFDLIGRDGRRWRRL